MVFILKTKKCCIHKNESLVGILFVKNEKERVALAETEEKAQSSGYPFIVLDLVSSSKRLAPKGFNVNLKVSPPHPEQQGAKKSNLRTPELWAARPKLPRIMPPKPNWNHPEPCNEEVKLQIVYVADKSLTHLLGHNFIITEAYVLFDFCFYDIGVALVMVDLVNNTNPDYNMVTMRKDHPCISGFMDCTATKALVGQGPPCTGPCSSPVRAHYFQHP